MALPIISFSPAFTDEDLIEIVRGGSAVRQVAVAGRPEVSPGRGRCRRVRCGCEQAVRALAANDNADLSEAALGRCVDRFGQSPELVAAMAYRQVLPLSVTERLVDLAVGRGARASGHAVTPWRPRPPFDWPQLRA